MPTSAPNLCRAASNRVFDGTTIRRVHSEDLCQDLVSRGQPQIRARCCFAPISGSPCAPSVTLPAQRRGPPCSRSEFSARRSSNLAVGNTDNHAKRTPRCSNSQPAGVLAPLYDVIPATMDARVTHELCADVSGCPFRGGSGASRISNGRGWLKIFGFFSPPPRARFSGHCPASDGRSPGPVSRSWRRPEKSLADGVAAQLCTLEMRSGSTSSAATRLIFTLRQMCATRRPPEAAGPRSADPPRTWGCARVPSRKLERPASLPRMAQTRPDRSPPGARKTERAFQAMAVDGNDRRSRSRSSGLA